LKARKGKVGSLQGTCSVKARQGWENAFRAMHERGNDELLDKNLLAQTYWDEEEWQWSDSRAVET
jgi:hypothetical protein